MQRKLFVVMRLGSAVVLSYLDAGFEPRCGRKDFLTACLLLLLKRVAHPWPLKGVKGGVKPRQGKPSSVISVSISQRFRAKDNQKKHPSPSVRYAPVQGGAVDRREVPHKHIRTFSGEGGRMEVL